MPAAILRGTMKEELTLVTSGSSELKPTGMTSGSAGAW